MKTDSESYAIPCSDNIQFCSSSSVTDRVQGWILVRVIAVMPALCRLKHLVRNLKVNVCQRRSSKSP